MFLVVMKKKTKKKQFIMEFIYCRRLKMQYFGAPKIRGLPEVVGIEGGCSYATGFLYWLEKGI